MAQLEFRVLGPVEVLRDGEPIDLGPPRQRAVLAALLVRANSVVPIDRLLDDLWGEDPPGGARHNLQVYVANLRKAFDPDGTAGRSTTLVTKAPGYALMTEIGALDALRFEELVTEGRRLRAAGDLAAASRALRAADDLWRGNAFADVAFENFAAQEATRLEEERISATEERIDADLALGRDAELVGEIEALTHSYPLRERLWGQRMIALYRSGRQADALRAYQSLREQLRDELGVEPSPQLRALETAVLEQSPSLDNNAEPATPPESQSAPPASGYKPATRTRRRIPLVAAVVIVVVVGVLIASVAFRTDGRPHVLTRARGYTPRFEATPCPSNLLAGVPNATCGDLVVPENRAKPTGRWLKLRVSVSPARRHRHSPDPVVEIGYAGIAEDPAKTPVRDYSTMITLETRVSLAPNPTMSCPEETRLTNSEFARPFKRRASSAELNALRHCYARLEAKGIDLAHYTYDDAADDVVDLARALHLNTINVASAEEDAFVAYELVRHEPALVRTLTLENPTGPGMTGVTDPTAELARAFDYFVALCNADTRCHHDYPNLQRADRNDYASIKAHPAVANTVLYGVRRTVLLDPSRATRALAQALTDPTTYGALPSIIDGGYATRLDLVAYEAAAYDFYWSVPNFPTAIALSQWCNYDQYGLSGSRDLSAHARPELSGVVDDRLSDACTAWPVPKAADALLRAPASTVPTLIVVGLLDPFTMPQWIAQLQSGLENSTALEFPTLGRNIFTGGLPLCLNTIRKNFLANPTAPIAAEACVRETPPIQFVGP